MSVLVDTQESDVDSEEAEVSHLVIREFSDGRVEAMCGEIYRPVNKLKNHVKNKCEECLWLLKNLP